MWPSGPIRRRRVLAAAGAAHQEANRKLGADQTFCPKSNPTPERLLAPVPQLPQSSRLCRGSTFHEGKAPKGAKTGSFKIRDHLIGRECRDKALSCITTHKWFWEGLRTHNFGAGGILKGADLVTRLANNNTSQVIGHQDLAIAAVSIHGRTSGSQRVALRVRAFHERGIRIRVSHFEKREGRRG